MSATANNTDEVEVKYLDLETMTIIADTSTIPGVIAHRKALGLTREPPVIPPEHWDVIDQALMYPPKGWEDFMRRVAQAELKIPRDKYLQSAYFPHPNDIFKAFHYVAPEHIKVVIVGQDPYHGVRPDKKPQATGLCFSVRSDEAIQPSLKTIFDEIRREYSDFSPYAQGDLTHWAQQGVLMINQSLSVAPGVPDSHDRGWISFINAMVTEIVEKSPKAIFVLWGQKAQKIIGGIVGGRANRLEAGHPSPLNRKRDFAGCGHFKLINTYLVRHGMDPILW